MRFGHHPLRGLWVPALMGAVLCAGPSWSAEGRGQTPVATVNVSSGGVTFAPRAIYERLALRVTGPGSFALQREFAPGQHVAITLGEGEARWPDGQYSYELRVVPHIDGAVRDRLRASREADEGGAPDAAVPTIAPIVQSGGFRVQNGALVVGGETERGGPEEGNPDQVIPDDLIVQGSACIGLDCVNNENFGFDTLRLKENNLRIKFDDTSTAPGFPANDWQLTANDSASGGQSKFSIEDITGSKVPFTVTAGAATNSIFVDSTGRLGLRTSVPVLDIHVNTSNTPAMRLEQNNSGGFTAQTWDVAGNEANFFVRDVTGGSRLPLRIRPGAPTSSIDISASGNVGVGTASPSASLHVARTDGTTQLLLAETSTTASTRRLLDMQNNGGIRMRMSDNSTSTAWAFQNIGTQFLLDANGGANEMILTTTGDMTITGTLTQLSDRNAKTDIEPVDGDDVLARVGEMPINTWVYKANSRERHLGPMAQDFAAAFGLGADDLHVAPSDVAGVALAAIQALDTRLKEREAEMAALQAQNAQLAARLAALESALSAAAPASSPER